ncbi:MAG: hypothetical protein ACD_72C00407G0004 [uncultured bacterium]|nr:MAG: hypothetical protein ACD_72C00407G0004 [uncultured bacterium]
MIIPKPADTLHKAWLYRLLTKLADDIWLTQHLYFKGGTCAALLNRLDRFSVDLDFDFIEATPTTILACRTKLKQHFSDLGLTIKDESKIGLQYFLKYAALPNQRSIIKVEASFPPPQSNIYETLYFDEIDRTLCTQTIETMFANKLVALLDRWEKHQSLAGRDIYDIHYFFLRGYRYHTAIIEERRATSVEKFFQELITFIASHVTTTVLQQDLNMLLPAETFQRIRPILKAETLRLLNDELKRLHSKQ